MELVQEKKRKNYVADYFFAMEMRLMELLDFILQDEPEYFGLDPKTKTQQVLRNLENFQGKSIEGESKINLLRIFFEEFTALKKEKDQK
jgi:DNA modification methylase